MSGEMKRGAVAIIDALGFKGIWKLHGAEAILDTLRVMKADAMDDTGMLNSVGVAALDLESTLLQEFRRPRPTCRPRRLEERPPLPRC